MHMIRISPSETLFLGREAERESLLSCGCFPVKTVPFPLPLAWREVDGEGRSRAWLIRLRSTTSGLELAVPLSLYMISKISLSLSPWLFSFSDTAYGTPSPAIHAGEIEERERRCVSKSKKKCQIEIRVWFLFDNQRVAKKQNQKVLCNEFWSFFDLFCFYIVSYFFPFHAHLQLFLFDCGCGK